MASTKAKKEDKETTGIMEESALNELFADELADIYWVEECLAKALPKMAKAAASEEPRVILKGSGSNLYCRD